MHIEETDSFRRDVVEHYRAIAKAQPAAADRFVQNVDELIDALIEYPLHGRVWGETGSRLADVRVRKVPGFNILIFYHAEDNQVTVLRAFHGARGDMMGALADELRDL